MLVLVPPFDMSFSSNVDDVEVKKRDREEEALLAQEREHQLVEETGACLSDCLRV